MKISPDLIPHTEFHTGVWLQSVIHPGWYYFLKRKNPNLITNPAFMETVDPPLKNLVAFLHQKGIKTTPSCAGHFFKQVHFEKLYANLEQDREIIRNGGLQLIDVQNENVHLFRNKHYELPWGRDEFFEKISQYQKKGILGIRLRKNARESNDLLNIKINGVTIYEKDGILFIHSELEDVSAIDAKWEEITSRIKEILA